MKTSRTSLLSIVSNKSHGQLLKTNSTNSNLQWELTIWTVSAFSSQSKQVTKKHALPSMDMNIENHLNAIPNSKLEVYVTPDHLRPLRKPQLKILPPLPRSIFQGTLIRQVLILCSCDLSQLEMEQQLSMPCSLVTKRASLQMLLFSNASLLVKVMSLRVSRQNCRSIIFNLQKNSTKSIP